MASESIEGRGASATTLRLESKGTLKHALQYYVEFEPKFSETFFPDAARRGYVVWSDVEQLSARQADALRPMLADSIRYFSRHDERSSVRSLEPGGPDSTPSAGSSELGRKAQLWTDALRDLCVAFDLDFPL
jgi:hypothetical protein